MKTLHLFRTDQTWEENLLRVTTTIKTILIREVPGLQMAGGEESILKKYHCISPGSISFLVYLLLTLGEKILRDGLWDCSRIPSWTERIQQAYPVYPSFSGVKCSKKILIKIMCAKKPKSICLHALEIFSMHKIPQL